MRLSLQGSRGLQSLVHFVSALDVAQPVKRWLPISGSPKSLSPACVVQSGCCLLNTLKLPGKSSVQSSPGCAWVCQPRAKLAEGDGSFLEAAGCPLWASFSTWASFQGSSRVPPPKFTSVILPCMDSDNQLPHSWWQVWCQGGMVGAAHSTRGLCMSYAARAEGLCLP